MKHINLFEESIIQGFVTLLDTSKISLHYGTIVTPKKMRTMIDNGDTFEILIVIDMNLFEIAIGCAKSDVRIIHGIDSTFFKTFQRSLRRDAHSWAFSKGTIKDATYHFHFTDLMELYGKVISSAITPEDLIGFNRTIYEFQQGLTKDLDDKVPFVIKDGMYSRMTNRCYTLLGRPEIFFKYIEEPIFNEKGTEVIRNVRHTFYFISRKHMKKLVPHASKDCLAVLLNNDAQCSLLQEITLDKKVLNDKPKQLINSFLIGYIYADVWHAIGLDKDNIVPEHIPFTTEITLDKNNVGIEMMDGQTNIQLNPMQLHHEIEKQKDIFREEHFYAYEPIHALFYAHAFNMTKATKIFKIVDPKAYAHFLKVKDHIREQRKISRIFYMIDKKCFNIHFSPSEDVITNIMKHDKLEDYDNIIKESFRNFQSTRDVYKLYIMVFLEKFGISISKNMIKKITMEEIVELEKMKEKTHQIDKWNEIKQNNPAKHIITMNNLNLDDMIVSCYFNTHITHTILKNIFPKYYEEHIHKKEQDEVEDKPKKKYTEEPIFIIGKTLQSISPNDFNEFYSYFIDKKPNNLFHNEYSVIKYKVGNKKYEFNSTTFEFKSNTPKKTYKRPSPKMFSQLIHKCVGNEKLIDFVFTCLKEYNNPPEETQEHDREEPQNETIRVYYEFIEHYRDEFTSMDQLHDFIKCWLFYPRNVLTRALENFDNGMEMVMFLKDNGFKTNSTVRFDKTHDIFELMVRTPNILKITDNIATIVQKMVNDFSNDECKQYIARNVEELDVTDIGDFTFIESRTIDNIGHFYFTFELNEREKYIDKVKEKPQLEIDGGDYIEEEGEPIQELWDYDPYATPISPPREGLEDKDRTPEQQKRHEYYMAHREEMIIRAREHYAEKLKEDAKNGIPRIRRRKIHIDHSDAKNHAVDVEDLEESDNLTLQDIANHLHDIDQSFEKEETTKSYEKTTEPSESRSEIVKDIVRSRMHDDICEGCRKNAKEIGMFLDTKGRIAWEFHHITFLSRGGEDEPYNTAGLCQICHARVHRGKDGAEFNEKIRSFVLQKEMERLGLKDPMELTKHYEINV